MTKASHAAALFCLIGCEASSTLAASEDQVATPNSKEETSETQPTRHREDRRLQGP